VVTGAATPDSPVAGYVHAHGDGVRDIALVADDASTLFRRAVEGGAKVIPPEASGGSSTRPMIATFGDTVHTLLDGNDPLALSVAGEPTGIESLGPVGLVSIDHYAVSVESGGCAGWTSHYGSALGFEPATRDEHVEVNGSAFTMSTVRVPGGPGAFVFAEPAPSRNKSQIAHYLEQFGGPGVHHIAFSTNDIRRTVLSLRTRGIPMLEIAASYSRNADERLREIDVDWRELADLGVMVDVDDEGYLLQAFTQPLGDRPTTYLEIIQREGTKGFGAQNVRALYSTVVREQEQSHSSRS
jgi:4-hydroxyphenylpyruvate dioxygenase